MPTYEYACSSCQNQWEEVQRISAPPLTVCPKCQKETAQRQISGGNFILKGGGWYADLYSSSKPSSNTGATGSKASEGSSSTESKSSDSGGASSGASGASSSSTETKSAAPAAPAKKD